MGTVVAAAEEMVIPEALGWAHPVVAEWFARRFGTATEPQVEGWPAVVRGEATLISAPTGSGKTLAAFLVAIDGLLREAIEGRLEGSTRVVYCSPLKALSNDVQKNLEAPLREIQALALERGYLCAPIRCGVRTGDTPTKDRVRMLKEPPHILVTTPESLYLLLTAAKSRENLRRVRTVIVDEIHAVAGNKRGTHLALSLERLEALVCGDNKLAVGAWLTGATCGPQRIGLSATQNPIEVIADFLTGVGEGRERATIVQVGQRRELDLAIEVPGCEELSSLTTGPMWAEMFDRLAALTETHRSVLVFVNTRRLVEKIAFELQERLGEGVVGAHHGSLSRGLRLEAEQKLKAGELKILIATASLELGIDIGSIDLVCQVATTRNVGVAMQRVGRAGHWRGAVPKGRLFATTRDDLMEQAALVRAMRRGELDQMEVPSAPVDVLMQQITACCGAESWDEECLWGVLRRAYPYREMTRAEFDEVLKLLHEGIVAERGRFGAYVMRDGVQGQVHGRRGARMTAIANGGAIPDVSSFAVILQPEGVQIATLDEHFAVDSSPGDVVLLGNTSWRIVRIETAGKVFVEDAHGAPPSLPFWEGEAPQRTAVLSRAVGELREEIAARVPGVAPSNCGPAHPEVSEACAWLRAECGVCAAGAMQLVRYIVEGRAALGAVPTQTTVIAERFFDEGGGQQLILHAPFGGRLNKAWGLALRKRFCRGFNFELQAAATDNGINISLAEQHSFPLSDVFQFLTEKTARELLEQAAIPSPLFKNRWRWAAGRSLQLLRMRNGKRVAPQIQRTRSDDLLANVFPQAAACFETIVGDIQIPDHPLVREVMRDTLSEAMDIDGLNEVLRGIASGAIRCLAVDSPVPSVFAHELIHAMPYAFLDEAGAEERRARAVSMRRTMPANVADGAGRLDAAAIATVRAESFPDVRDAHELHDLLLSLVVMPAGFAERAEARGWGELFGRLCATGRAQEVVREGEVFWVAAERVGHAGALWGGSAGVGAGILGREGFDGVGGLADAGSFALLRMTATTEDEKQVPPSASSGQAFGNDNKKNGDEGALTAEAAVAMAVQGWMQVLGPVTSAGLATMLGVEAGRVFQAMVAGEMQGLAMRGVFEGQRTADSGQRTADSKQVTDSGGALEKVSETVTDHFVEWCDRRLLQRIHRLTMSTLRKRIEPVSPAAYMEWLLGWQHVAPRTQLAGEEGVLEALAGLEGFEAPAVEWERTLLPARVAAYDPRWLDALCLAGVVGWGRVSPHPAWSAGEGGAPRRVIPTNAAPITFFLRDTAEWLPWALAEGAVEEAVLARSLSENGLRVRRQLAERGACFAADLIRVLGMTKQEVQHALWELATAGLAAADGFDQLRALMDPRRKAAVTETAAPNTRRRTAARATAGRWSLLAGDAAPRAELSAVERARLREGAMESAVRMLLARYGVVFRDVLTRESNAPKWRELQPMLRRLEARGEVRGGRFVTGVSGEQYALAEAADSLRAAGRERGTGIVVTVAAADPTNLAGIVVPGERVAGVSGRSVRFRDGVAVDEAGESTGEAVVRVGARRFGGRAGVVEAAVTVAARESAQMGLLS